MRNKTNASNMKTQTESLINYVPLFKLDRAQGPLRSETE